MLRMAIWTARSGANDAKTARRCTPDSALAASVASLHAERALTLRWYLKTVDQVAAKTGCFSQQFSPAALVRWRSQVFKEPAGPKRGVAKRKTSPNPRIPRRLEVRNAAVRHRHPSSHAQRRSQPSSRNKDGRALEMDGDGMEGRTPNPLERLLNFRGS